MPGRRKKQRSKRRIARRASLILAKHVAAAMKQRELTGTGWVSACAVLKEIYPMALLDKF